MRLREGAKVICFMDRRWQKQDRNTRSKFKEWRTCVAFPFPQPLPLPAETMGGKSKGQSMSKWRGEKRPGKLKSLVP